MTAAVAVIILFVYQLHYVLLPFVFAAAVAFVVEPVIRHSQRRTGAARWVVATVCYLLLLLALAAILYFLGRTIVADVTQLATRAPIIVRRLMQDVGGTRRHGAVRPYLYRATAYP